MIRASLLVLAIGCLGSSTATVDGPASVDSASGERTLDSCATAIDASVPADHPRPYTPEIQFYNSCTVH